MSTQAEPSRFRFYYDYAQPFLGQSANSEEGKENEFVLSESAVGWL
jgi:hypothetical protein